MKAIVLEVTYGVAMLPVDLMAGKVASVREEIVLFSAGLIF